MAGPRQRKKRTTVLAVGEGLTEIAFLKHLRREFGTRGNRAYKFVEAGGGSPRHVVEKALRIYSYGSYDAALVLADLDKLAPNDTESSLRELAGYSIHVYLARPCIEAIILDMLYPDRQFSRAPTADVKREFHKVCIPEARKTDPLSYADIDALSKPKIQETLKNAKTNDYSLQLVAQILRRMF